MLIRNFLLATLLRIFYTNHALGNSLSRGEESTPVFVKPGNYKLCGLLRIPQPVWPWMRILRVEVHIPGTYQGREKLIQTNILLPSNRYLDSCSQYLQALVMILLSEAQLELRHLHADNIISMIVLKLFALAFFPMSSNIPLV